MQIKTKNKLFTILVVIICSLFTIAFLNENYKLFF
ncbi:MAG: hypothetical protein AB2N28_2800 [Candidatus Phytoplasma solani]|uniref:Uncharacterized protein n=1 Tax=Candidatus Phytoplasma solani TaxID=69896 RepID=A0A421NYK8_9MOLU|nr:hypothetical protein PSSA1_v1c0060 [Candidatus Phytoplasma solani]